MERSAPRRMISRSSSDLEAAQTSLGSRLSSPHHRRPAHDIARKHGDATTGRTLWPSTSKKPGTLADHLGNDRLIDLVERDPSLHHHRTRSSELDGDDNNSSKGGRLHSKENRSVGGSMRYVGRLSFGRSSPSHPATAGALSPGRISYDEGAFDRSERLASPVVARPVAAEPTMKRANSYRSSASQWALSPGRAGGRSFSNLRPASPGKPKVGNFISSLSFDMFRKKPSSVGGGGGGGVSSAPPAVGAVYSPRSGSGWPAAAVGEAGHQFRMLHNRLVQWRYVNARSGAANHVKAVHAEETLFSALMSMYRLQVVVVQKQLLLGKQKLGFKVSTLLSSQMKALECWGDMERHHSTALATTKDGLQSAIYRVPLVEGAEADPQDISVELRNATDLATTVATTINTFASTARDTVPLLVELAQVVTREKSMLEECFELLSVVSALQLQEQSLKCHLIQLHLVA